MTFKKIQQGPIDIIGVELRTTKQDEKALQKIPVFWDNFYKENISAKIPHKISDDIYSVYTHFEHEGKDNKGMYSMIIGCAVDNVQEIPESMVNVSIPKSNYAAFEIESTAPKQLGEKVYQAWQKIWKLSAQDKNFNQQRTYLTEFEYYTAPGKGIVYIGLK